MSYFYSAEHSFVKDINGELVQIVYNYFHGEKECCFCEFSIISLSKSKEKITIPEFYIPTEIDGFKVLDIGDGVNAIHSCKNLTDERIIINKLIIPSCMKIHCAALSNIKNVQEVEIKSCSAISAKCFSGSSFQNISIPNDVEKIGMWAFKGTKIKQITIPDKCTVIGDYLFTNCECLEKVILGKGITLIPKKCFYGCDSLKSVILSGQINTIKENAFRDCPNLSELDLSNSIYCDLPDDVKNSTLKIKLPFYS